MSRKRIVPIYGLKIPEDDQEFNSQLSQSYKTGSVIFAARTRFGFTAIWKSFTANWKCFTANWEHFKLMFGNSRLVF